ncbi:MAG TPA: PD-(D/E)XK nuclease family protein [Acidimicrobiia bacterium]|nr:PD-(D/E)XK nuclease family protein [Acidimicrobiia bacterium]
MTLDTTETPLDQPRLTSLSPSRASDFKTCPQLYKFKSIDKIPTVPTPHQARGTTAHLALERLFTEPAPLRTPDRLYDLFREAWAEIKPEEYPDLFATLDEERAWGIESLGLLAAYFGIEDPTAFEPEELEMDLTADIRSDDMGSMTIRGILDRMERITETNLDGSERELLVITDYKTGKAPPEQYAHKAFFALKIYALLIRVTRGITPDRVRLLYLNGPTEYTMDINDAQLDAMERQLQALWKAIQKAIDTDVWPARTSALCDWCDFKDTLCPAWNRGEGLDSAGPDPAAGSPMPVSRAPGSNTGG